MQMHSRTAGHEIWRAPETFKQVNHDGEYGGYQLKADVYGWAVTTASVSVIRYF